MSREITELSTLTREIGTCLVTLSIYEGSVNIWHVWGRLSKTFGSLFWRQMLAASILQLLGLIPMLVYGPLYAAFRIDVMPLTSYGPWFIFNGYIVYTMGRVDQLIVIKRALSSSSSSSSLGSNWKRICFWTLLAVQIIMNVCFIFSFAGLPGAIALFNLNNALVVLLHLANLFACIVYYREIGKFHASKQHQKTSSEDSAAYWYLLMLLPIVLEILNLVALPLAVLSKGQIVVGMYTSICTPILDLAIMVRYTMRYTLAVLAKDAPPPPSSLSSSKRANVATLDEDPATHSYAKPNLSQFANVSRLE